MSAEVSSIEIAATVCFAIGILHTFSVNLFQSLAHKYPEGSVGENFFHLLGEVEVVFGLWAAVLLAYIGLDSGAAKSLEYLESRNFTEPAFVFVIMAISGTRPILLLATSTIERLASFLPLPGALSFFVTCLVVGPLMGSFITEPASMTVTALILLQRFYSAPLSNPLKYAIIGLLFVNISIGGTLTPFAAPPVLMVAGVWSWDLEFMLKNFGWKAVIAVFLATVVVAVRFRHELSRLTVPKQRTDRLAIPIWVSLAHLGFLGAVVVLAHHPLAFAGVFLFFLGLAKVTQEYQDELRIKEALLVAFFLGGLVLLGGLQRWWLEPILTRLDAASLYLGAIGLTAFTDNAALTYLGSQVPTLSEASKYALVAGSVVGGGLTVIANAPNPAGFGILNSSFGTEGISPLLLLKSALLPTLIAAVCFWFL